METWPCTAESSKDNVGRGELRGSKLRRSKLNVISCLTSEARNNYFALMVMLTLPRTFGRKRNLIARQT
ncbi:MAG: hypothetical protein ACTS7I_02845 [Candidatus Hodgkinia cicadicola]